MEKFIKKNLKWIALILLFLFFIKSFQSCLRKTTIARLEKTTKYECDSLLNDKDIIIDSLQSGWNIDNKTKDYIIQDLTNELKITGVNVDAKEKTIEFMNIQLNESQQLNKELAKKPNKTTIELIEKKDTLNNK